MIAVQIARRTEKMVAGETLALVAELLVEVLQRAYENASNGA